MTLHRARKLLDQVRRGADAPEREINEALIATGDMDDDWPTVQRVLAADEWPRKPPGLAPAQWHEVIA